MGFFGIGVPELLVILVIALIFFGPRRLPEIGRSIGEAVRDFRRMSAGFGSEWEELSKELEETKSEAERGVREMGAELEELEDEVQKTAKME
ncbi:MAG: TatA/E family twin arginine-targeting protein translocase [Chloroflexota bacterium]|nr:TatA/E family twin arginine-targeting protein translocase [Chloroflexota bacterium]